MWCILFYIGFVRDPASILVGFVGDLPKYCVSMIAE